MEKLEENFWESFFQGNIRQYLGLTTILGQHSTFRKMEKRSLLKLGFLLLSTLSNLQISICLTFLVLNTRVIPWSQPWSQPSLSPNKIPTLQNTWPINISVSFKVVTSQQWRFHLVPHFRRGPTGFGVNFKMGEVGNIHTHESKFKRGRGSWIIFLTSRISFFMFKYFCLVSNTKIYHFVKVFAISKLT